MRLTIDSAASRVTVRTRATGLLARLAHDLELVSREVSGATEIDGEAWSAQVTVPVASLRVAGTLRGDRLDPSGLSAADRAEIERKVRTEVLGASEVVARGQGTSRDGGEITVTARSSSSAVRSTLAVREQEAPRRFTVKGRTVLSLRALGIAEVKGPLGAFKLEDAVEVLYELELA